jgi:GntR family transcriptional regulator of vanillate catabolism
MILRGEFRPGERIAEIPLSLRLGISRTPVRLALERLSQEGLVEPSSSGGFTVREFSKRDIWDAIEMRGVLEGMAARLAAERITDSSELDVLRHWNAEIDALMSSSTLAMPGAGPTDELSRYADLNVSFHLELVNLAKSPMLRWAVERIYGIPFASPSAPVPVSGRDIMPLAIEHHHEIIRAIEDRDGSLAERLTREHALIARRNLEIALTEIEHLSRLQLQGTALIKASS